MFGTTSGDATAVAANTTTANVIDATDAAAEAPANHILLSANDRLGIMEPSIFMNAKFVSQVQSIQAESERCHVEQPESMKVFNVPDHQGRRK